MKKILFVVCMFMSSLVFSQKSALDYSNETSTMYLQNKKNDAFFHVKRALEIYDNNELLSELYNLIKPEDEPPHQCENPNQDEQKQDGEQNQESDGGSGSQGDEQQDSQDQSDADKNSEGDDNADNPEKSESQNTDESKQDDSASGKSNERDEKDSSDDSELAEKDKKQADDEPREGAFSQMNDANSNEQKEGQISTMEAEMLLRAIEDKDKELQMHLQQQKSQKSKRTTVEKDW